MFRKDNLVLTFVSGEKIFESKTFWVFIESCQKQITNADLVILLHNVSEKYQTQLDDLEIEYILLEPEEIHSIYQDRHRAYFHYLNDHGHKYQYILTTDCRDVMFQANPFDWLELWKNRYKSIKGCKKFLNHFVTLTAEGFKMQQNGYACISNFEFQRDIPLPYQQTETNHWVTNAGLALGTPRALQDYHFLVWVTSMKTLGNCSDQATVNWLMYYLQHDDTYSLSFPQHDNLCLTGEGIKEKAVEPIIQNGQIFNPKNDLYYILHQWDRIDYLSDLVLAQSNLYIKMEAESISID